MFVLFAPAKDHQAENANLSVYVIYESKIVHNS